MALTRDGDLGTVNRYGPASLGYSDGLTVLVVGVGGLPFASWRLNMTRWDHGRDAIGGAALLAGGLDDPHCPDSFLCGVYRSLSGQGPLHQPGIMNPAPA